MSQVLVFPILSFITHNLAYITTIVKTKQIFGNFLLRSGVLNIKEADNPRKYLGLPSVWNISKKEALGYIKERILKLIHGWSNKELSLAGKEVLLKVVATAISAYPITCFKLPITLCNKINMVMASFWWGDNVSGRKVP
ncbi:unnamed protein product [Prunus armeniaca]